MMPSGYEEIEMMMRETKQKAIRDDYQVRMKERLGAWFARLEVLEAAAIAPVDEAARAVLASWRSAGGAARARLEELEAATGNRWRVVRTRMVSAWNALAALPANGSAVPGSVADMNPATRITQRGFPVSLPDSPE